MGLKLLLEQAVVKACGDVIVGMLVRSVASVIGCVVGKMMSTPCTQEWAKFTKHYTALFTQLHSLTLFAASPLLLS